MAVVMGLDISLTKTGICVRKDGKVILTTSVKTATTTPWVERINAIHEKIFGTISALGVTFVVIENYSFGSTNGRETLGEIHGILMYDLIRKGIPYLKVPPTQAKLFGCGAGKAPKCPPDQAKSTWAKKWVTIEVNKRYGTDFRLADNDECDAYIIAILAETLLAVEENKEVLERLPSHQAEVMRTILNIPKPKKPRRKN